MSEKSEKSIEKPTQSQWEVLDSESRFLIWQLLSIYQKLSLSEISKMLHKSKSTVHEHLQKMLEVEAVFEIKEGKHASGLEKVFYSLAPEVLQDRRTSMTHQEICTEEDCKSSIQGQILFIHQTIHNLEIWLKFLEELENKFDKGDTKTVMETYEKARTQFGKPLSIISFYSNKQANLFREELMQLYRKYEQQEDLLQSQERIEKPVLAAMQFVPMKFILDYYHEKKM